MSMITLTRLKVLLFVVALSITAVSSLSYGSRSIIERLPKLNQKDEDDPYNDYGYPIHSYQAQADYDQAKREYKLAKEKYDRDIQESTERLFDYDWSDAGKYGTFSLVDD